MGSHEEIYKIFAELNSSFGDKDKQILHFYQQKEEECYKSAKGNPDKFADCIYPSIKRREDEEQRLGYRTEFLMTQLKTCLDESKGDAGKLAKCKEITKNEFGNQVDGYLKKLSEGKI